MSRPGGKHRRRQVDSLVMRFSNRRAGVSSSGAGRGGRAAALMGSLRKPGPGTVLEEDGISDAAATIRSSGSSSNSNSGKQNGQVAAAGLAIARAAQENKAEQAAGASDGEEKFMGAMLGLQKKMHKYEQKRWSEKAARSATTLQKNVRRLLVRLELPKRSMRHKSASLVAARGALRGFEFRETKYRLDSYKVLIRLLEADLTFQDMLNEVVHHDMLRDMHDDLFARSLALRQHAVHFLTLFAHNHRGNQRLVCGLNGVTVGGVRLVAVSARFEKQFFEWCVSHGLETTYEGTVRFIEGVVTTAAAYYKNTQRFDKKKVVMRDSVFSYPKAYTYSEMDPHTHLIGINLRADTAEHDLHSEEVGEVRKLMALFDKAAASHGDPATLLDSLVPAVPLYSLLAVLRHELAGGSLPGLVHDFLGSLQDVVNLSALGKLGDHLPDEERTVILVDDSSSSSSSSTEPVRAQSITTDVLGMAARSGMSVLWAPVAAKFTQHVIYQRFGDLCKAGGVACTAHLADLFPAAECFEGTDSRADTVPGLMRAKFVKRVDLVAKLKLMQCRDDDRAASTGERRLLPKGMSDELFLWDLMGPLREEDHFHALERCCKDAGGNQDGGKGSGRSQQQRLQVPLPGHGVRVTVANASAGGRSAEARTAVGARLGGGQCNWDWICWDEFIVVSIAALRRSIGVPHRGAGLRAAAALKSLPDPKTGVWAPSKVGNTARRLKQLQKMLRSSQKLPEERTTPQELARRACLEHELMLLSQALGRVDPILSPAYTCVAKDPAEPSGRAGKGRFGLHQRKSQSADCALRGRRGSGRSSRSSSSSNSSSDEGEGEGEGDEESAKLGKPGTAAPFRQQRRRDPREVAAQRKREQQQRRGVTTARIARAAERRQEAARKAAQRAEQARRLREATASLAAERQLKATMAFARDSARAQVKEAQAAAAQSRRQRQRFLMHERDCAEAKALERRMALVEERQKVHGVEGVDVSKTEYRDRVDEFDSLTRVRNQLIFNPPQVHGGEGGADIPVNHLPSRALAAYATQAAPIWALCKEGMQSGPKHGASSGGGCGGGGNAGEAGAHPAGSDSLLAQVQRARAKEEHMTAVGGFMFKAKDVAEINDKRFTLDEIRGYTSKYRHGAHPVSSRSAAIIAKHAFNKQMIKQQLGFEVRFHTQDDLLNVMADLQGDDVDRLLPTDKQRELESKEDAEKDEVIRAFLEQTTRQRRALPGRQTMTPAPPAGNNKRTSASASPRAASIRQSRTP